MKDQKIEEGYNCYFETVPKKGDLVIDLFIRHDGKIWAGRYELPADKLNPKELDWFLELMRWSIQRTTKKHNIIRK